MFHDIEYLSEVSDGDTLENLKLQLASAIINGHFVSTLWAQRQRLKVGLGSEVMTKDAIVRAVNAIHLLNESSCYYAVTEQAEGYPLFYQLSVTVNAFMSICSSHLGMLSGVFISESGQFLISHDDETFYLVVGTQKFVERCFDLSLSRVYEKFVEYANSETNPWVRNLLMSIHNAYAPFATE